MPKTKNEKIIPTRSFIIICQTLWLWIIKEKTISVAKKTSLLGRLRLRAFEILSVPTII